jgi:hypothetical protein
MQGISGFDGTQSNEPSSAVANDHHKPSINEPGTKMSANTRKVSVLAKFMLQQIAQKSAAEKESEGEPLSAPSGGTNAIQLSRNLPR